MINGCTRISTFPPVYVVTNTRFTRECFVAMLFPQMDAPLFERIGGLEKLRTFLWHFYADVRQHQVIGPIFNARIKDWPEHVAKIAQFWARATGGPSTYAGQMPVKHLTLGLQPEHFAAWLELWDWNCQRHLAPTEAAEMSALAHGIGARLKQIVATTQALPPRGLSFS